MIGTHPVLIFSGDLADLHELGADFPCVSNAFYQKKNKLE